MISVIVPVYNVEPYLRECLDSILAQTFRDLEVILVDDGSTDGSGRICDEYQRKDNRIVVFHAENHGLSAARNLGIDNAHGEWLMFVDSDDWVKPEFCMLPYQTAIEHKADMVIFGIMRVHRDLTESLIDLELNGEVTQEQAVSYGRNAAWNKLYRRELFDGIRYPARRLYEDALTTYKTIYQAKKIIFLNIPLYYYRSRDGSIVKNQDVHDAYRAILEKSDGLHNSGHERDLRELLRCSLHYLEKTGPADDELHHRAEEIVSTVSVDPSRLSAHERNCMKLWKMNRKLFYTVVANKTPMRKEDSDERVCQA